MYVIASTHVCMYLMCRCCLACCSASEVKEHPFFAGVDWNQVYHQKYPPPLIPPRGEVNAADAFDIGSFDEEETKGQKVCTCTCMMRYGLRCALSCRRLHVDDDFAG